MTAEKRMTDLEKAIKKAALGLIDEHGVSINVEDVLHCLQIQACDVLASINEAIETVIYETSNDSDDVEDIADGTD